MRRRACGKPYVEGAPEFNLSHRGTAIAAFSMEAVGIDVESIGQQFMPEELATRFFLRRRR